MKAIIVDDEPHVLAVARLLVDWEKYHIHQLFECMDATEALEIIEREQPAILLSDIRMPQMDGLTLIEKAREKNPDLKSILISAYSDFAYAQKAVGLGCVDYLLKPLTEEGLNDAVEKAVTQYNYEKNLRSESQSDKSHILFSRYLQEGRSNEYWQNLLAAAPFLADTELFHLGILFSQEEDTALEPVAEFLHQYLYRENLGIAALRSKNIIVVLLPVYDYSPVDRVQQLTPSGWKRNFLFRCLLHSAVSVFSPKTGMTRIFPPNEWCSSPVELIRSNRFINTFWNIMRKTCRWIIWPNTLG